MLSDDLRTLRGYLARFQSAGLAIQPPRIADLIDYVSALISDAEALEHSVVDSPEGGRRFTPYELALIEQRRRRFARERINLVDGDGQ